MTVQVESVLLVEDELQLAKALQLSLKKIGINSIVHVPNLNDAKKFFSGKRAEEFPSLLLLDRMLPDGNGLTFCKYLRDDLKFDGAIIILSAIGESENRVEGLDAGADDYLAKPFSFDELRARIQSVMRRHRHVRESSVRTRAGGRVDGRGTSEHVDTLGKADDVWQIDSKTLRVCGPKGWIRLTPLEFKLVSRLMAEPGVIISRDVLLKDVWGFKFLTNTRTVDFFLTRIRRNFEKDPKTPVHFVTVRGAGYRFDP